MISPRLLDWAINGVPVYIRRRPFDGVIYATTHDFSRFIDEPVLATVRVPITAETPADFNPEEHESVLKKLAELR